MEIRLQSRGTGVTSWLVGKAMRNALDNPSSANWYVSPVQSSCTRAFQELRCILCKGTKTESDHGFHRAFLPNGSRIDFVTLDFYLFACDRILNPVRKFFYLDNMESVTASRTDKMHYYAFDRIDDMYMGGTVDVDGAMFRAECDYLGFLRRHSLNMAFCNSVAMMFDYILDKHILGEEHASARGVGRCNCCDGCLRRNTECLEIGDFLSVGRSCPMYPEMLVHEINGEKRDGDNI